MADDENAATTALERFYAHLLPWLREHGVSDAAEVTSVESYGTDWAGGTEEGFYSTFDITIRGKRENGSNFMTEYTGEDLTSLWKWTVQAIR